MVANPCDNIENVRCPRCRTLIQDNQCPQCGLQITPIRERKRQEDRDRPAAIGLDFKLQSRRPPRSAIQLISEPGRAAEKTSTAQAFETPAQVPGPATEKDSTAGEDTALFDYKKPPAAKKVTAFPEAQPKQPVLEKPVIRTPTRPRAGRADRPRQQKLRLEAATAEARSASSLLQSEELGAPRTERVSREILFSRLLSGIIDFILAVTTALLFTVSAMWILNFDLFTLDALRWLLLFSVCFFIFNSAFFLLASGQTPGMYMTDLRLEMENSEDEQSLFWILFRVFLLLPVAATVVGLVPCLFDPHCRGLHDLLSRSRIVPVEEER